MSSWDILADIDDGALQACPKCGEKYGQPNYVSFSKVPVSCSLCTPKAMDRKDWLKSVEKFAADLAAKRKAGKL
jgi:uncharacterized protein (DUF983 family)